MIRMPTLDEARAEAALLTAKGLTVYIYRLRSLPNQGGGGYWLTLTTPHEVNLWKRSLEQAPPPRAPIG
jgi:hypothetical protein